jgi:hypothetical protein
MMNRTWFCSSLAIALLAFTETFEGAVVFLDDFDSPPVLGQGVSGGFSGSGVKESVQGYSAYGFQSNLLRNSSMGNPAASTTLTLMGLPSHTSVDLNFLLAVIDSWDGVGSTSFGPDSFTVKVDGVIVFDEVFDNAGPIIADNLPPGVQTYVPGPGVELARMIELGFRDLDNNDQDSAYGMSFEPLFQNISHTANTLRIEMFASGAKWQGGSDESWAVDNFRVTVNSDPVLHSWNIDSNGNWSAAANWSGGIPNGTSARAVFGSIITQPRVVTVNTPIVVARIDFDNARAYTVGGSNPLTLETTSGDAEINVVSGSHTIAAPLTLANDTVIYVGPAASNLAITALATSGVTLTKAGAGTLTVNNIRATRLSVNEGTVAVAPNGTAAGTSVVGALSIAGGAAPTAKLDLGNNAAVIDYTGASPVGEVRQQILAGRGMAGFGATWTGNGITSSAAAIEPQSRSVGYAENSSLPLGPYAAFRGQSVDDSSLLMTYTRTGDANLDGVVNDADVTIVSATYAPGVPQPHWALGDFDYNGFVDDADVTLLGVFYDPTAAPLAAPEAVGVTAVPEPASWVMLILGGIITASRLARKSGRGPLGLE